MAIVKNEIDKILQAAATRTTNDPGAALLLAASAQLFKVTSGGNTPNEIVFTATPVALEGTISFSATGGTLTSITAKTATLTFANMTGTTAIVTASVTSGGQTFTASSFVTKVSDGDAGAAAQLYTWIRFADDINGTGISNDPTGKTHIGFATNKTSATESNTPTDYTWSLFKGGDGLPGENGYMWVKYSDNPDGTGLYDVPLSSTVYIGIAPNKSTPTESTNKLDYVWSRLKGEQGVPGPEGSGARGAGQYYAVGSAWSDAVADAATPGGNVVGDQVTIANGSVTYTKRWDGTSWLVPGAYMSGDFFIEGSINASKVNTNGLIVRAPNGTPLVGIGVPLDVSLAAPGTLNSEQTIGGLGYTDTQFESFGVTVRGNTLTKSGGTVDTWDASTRSTNGFVGGAFVSAIPTNYAYMAFGLNTDPASNNHWSTIDYAIEFAPDGTVLYMESGNAIAMSTYTPGDTFLLTYDGANVRYMKGGTVIRGPIAASITAPLFFDSSFFTLGGEIAGVKFGPMSNVSAGVQANAAIPGINSSIADKLSKTSASSLAATVTVATGGSILSGTTTNGTYQSPSGFYGVQGGVIKFSVPISGDPTFAGRLTAAYGTLGSLQIASGGGIYGGNFTSYAWPASGGVGFALSSDGALFGNFNDGRYLQLFANGDIKAPDFTIIGGVATYSGRLGGVMTLSITDNMPAARGNPNGATINCGSLTVNIAGGRAPFRPQWSIASYSDSPDHGTAQVSLEGADTVTATVKIKANNDTSVTGIYVCTVVDADGKTATISTGQNVQFGTPT